MKKWIAMLLLIAAVFSLAACGETPPVNTDTGSGSNVASGTDAGSADKSDGSSEKEEWEPVHVVDNLVMGNDGSKLNIYNLDLVEPGRTLDDAIVWSTPHGLGADMKYREDTVFGDVIVTTGASGANMISYPDGELLWSTNNPGNNPHSIEILPSGNIVVACSTGNTLRLFYTSALLNDDEKGAKKYEQYDLIDAHGVLYDPEYETLWALGGLELVGYLLTGSGTSEKLQLLGSAGAELPADKNGGHDLSPDFTSTQHLYVTVNSCVYRYDKEECAFTEKFPQNAKLNKPAVKGFSNNPNGNFFLTQVNNGKGTDWENETFADWCTDRITYAYWKSEHLLYVTEYISEYGNFYKTRVFYGQYQ